MTTFDFRRRLSAATVVLVALSAAAALRSGPTDLLPPTDFAVCQRGYGALGEVVLSWSNAERYEELEALVDGRVAPVRVDGAAVRTTISAAPGERVFGLRARSGGLASAVVERRFTVLAATPLRAPVREVTCGFVPGRGGRLVLGITPGTDAWVSGEVDLADAEEDGPDFVFLAGQPRVEVPMAGTEPPAVALRFKNAAGYFSEPLSPACAQVAPAFRRGDCDSSGSVNLSDPISCLNHLFLGGQRWFCDDACDADDDGEVGVSDPIRVLSYLFRGGPEPPAPGPSECGLDAAEDGLGGVCVCE